MGGEWWRKCTQYVSSGGSCATFEEGLLDLKLTGSVFAVIRSSNPPTEGYMFFVEPLQYVKERIASLLKILVALKILNIHGEVRTPLGVARS